MTTLNGDEPDLELGASGDHVVQLQDRLRGMGLLDKFPDGTYDDQTETAVRQLQSDLGQTNDGRVGQHTWQALDQRMLDLGLQYNPYAGPGQQHWDLEVQRGGGAQDLVPHEAAHVQQQHGDAGQQVEPYWDGQQWLQWDAQAGEWLPMSGQETAAATGAALGSEAGTAAAQPADTEPPVIPHPDNVHPAIRDDERFSDMIDFLREKHGA